MCSHYLPYKSSFLKDIHLISLIPVKNRSFSFTSYSMYLQKASFIWTLQIAEYSPNSATLDSVSSSQSQGKEPLLQMSFQTHSHIPSPLLPQVRDVERCWRTRAKSPGPCSGHPLFFTTVLVSHDHGSADRKQPSRPGQVRVFYTLHCQTKHFKRLRWLDVELHMNVLFNPSNLSHIFAGLDWFLLYLN